MRKLAIITTHPIQYNAPLFKLLNYRGIITIKVFYTWGDVVLTKKYDPGFGKIIEWDIPLLEGYDYTMVKNVSKNPGSHHYRGIINPTLKQEIEKWGADAILIYGWCFKSHLSCMRYFHKKIPIYFRGDSTLLDQGNNIIKDFLRKVFLKYVYKSADIFLYVGNENKKYYLNAGIKENQLIFVPHAVDNKRFSISPQINFRSQLKIPSNSIIYLFAGKFEDKKNPVLLIDAFLEINNLNTHLLLVGNGSMEKMLKSKVDELSSDIKNRIHFLDFQNQTLMPDLYKSCDVFVLPSQGPAETWGLVVNEAMACGKAIIVSEKCGCASDIVKNNINGFIFKNNDKIELIQAMKYFVYDTSISKKMGMMSKKIINEWSIENQAKKIEELLDII